MLDVSELFLAGALVSAIGCVIKVFKLCVFNVREVNCLGFSIYHSALFDRLVGEQSRANSNASMRGVNPMLPSPLLNV